MIFRMLPHLQVSFTGFAMEFERCLRQVQREKQGPPASA
jgi:hypothetical protein